MFSDLLGAKTNLLKLGNPADLACDVGPMISDRAATQIEARVNDAIASSATCLMGSVRSGSSYAPAVLADIPEDARDLSEEVFAPVVSIIPFNDIDEVIAQANTPQFLLHGAVFANDLRLAQKVCRDFACAGVMVNDSSDFRFDGMPFGGTERGAWDAKASDLQSRKCRRQRSSASNIAPRPLAPESGSDPVPPSARCLHDKDIPCVHLAPVVA